MDSRPSLGERVATSARAQLVGRSRERDQLRSWLVRGVGPAVVFVSGPGGIGKSVLVTATVAGLEERSVVLDGRRFEPTPAGFLAALSAELGVGSMGVQQAAIDVATADVGILVIDSFERLNLLDGWLRNEFLVALPADVATVLVGRRPPNAAWQAAPGWRSLIAQLVVSPLAEDDAAELVAGRGLTAPVAQRVLRFGQGHPLALELAATAFARHPDLELRSGPPAEAVEELCEVLLDDLDPLERQTVESASLLRRITHPLLDAILPSGENRTGTTETAWRALRDLPFTEFTPTGLELQPVVRSSIATALEIRDPARVRELRRRAAVAAVRDAAGGHTWDATADLLYLVQNPVIRNSYLPPGDQQHPVEAASSSDLDAILAIVARHDGAEATAVMQLWWRHHRDQFVVYRGRDAEVVAFSVVVRADQVDQRLVGEDPVLRAIVADLTSRPLPPDRLTLINRRALGHRRGDYASPELGAMVVDIKRHYLALRPALARVYTVVGHWPDIRPTLQVMGFDGFGPEITLGETAFMPAALDFGPASVDGWLLRHVLVEVDAAETASTAGAGSPLQPPPRQLPVLGLTAREREVLVALADGLTNNQLAERLFISERTANRHLSNIFGKLGVRNRTAAARVAIEAGLTG